MPDRGVAPLQSCGGDDLAHPRCTRKGFTEVADIRCRRRKGYGSARSRDQQRDRGIGEIEFESAACSSSVYHPIAIGLSATRRVRVVPIPDVSLGRLRAFLKANR
jgi:hypothetical protein